MIFQYYLEMSREQARDTLIELLDQRGYELLEEDDEQQCITALKPDGTLMITYFINDEKFNVQGMAQVLSIMNEMEVNHALVVYKVDITSTVNKILKQSEEKRVETLKEEDLQYNITKHVLQPKKVEKLDEQEAQKFKEKYGTKFGTYRLTDPLVKFYGYQKGDVIRVFRRNGSIAYRIVKG